jgi:hypothetical protein
MARRARANGEGSIYRYRNGWAAHVWITTPEGRRQRKSVYGKTREEVHAKYLALYDEAARGPVAPTSPRLGDFLDRWLVEVAQPSLAPATVSNYELFCRLYIRPDLGRVKLDRLTVRDVQVWLNALRARAVSAAPRARTPPGRSPGAVRQLPAAARWPRNGRCTRPTPSFVGHSARPFGRTS